MATIALATGYVALKATAALSALAATCLGSMLMVNGKRTRRVTRSSSGAAQAEPPAKRTTNSRLKASEREKALTSCSDKQLKAELARRGLDKQEEPAHTDDTVPMDMDDAEGEPSNRSTPPQLRL